MAQCIGKLEKQDNRTYVEILGHCYANTSFSKFEPKTLHKVRLTLFDFLTVLMVGRKHTVLTQLCKEYLSNKITNKECNALGMNLRTSADYAAFAMGIESHGVELDDGHRFSAAHPAVAVIPCAIAVAEKRDSSFDELLKSIIIGYDAMLRVAIAINPSHVLRGFHSTGTCGSIGAAAAAATLLRLDEDQMTNAIGIGILQGAGIQEMLHCSASSIKPLQPGKAAMAGVISADFAALGAKSPSLVFEGQYGWLNSVTDVYNESILVGKMGESWLIDYCYTKLYPSCRFAHAAIDIAIQLYREGYRVENIQNMQLYYSDFAIAEVGLIQSPKSYEEALYSASYSIAIALKYGCVRIEQLKASLQDEQIIRFSEQIKIISDEEMTKKFPDEIGARICFQIKEGKSIDRFIPVAKADFDTPLTDEECLEKAQIILKDDVSADLIHELWYEVVINDCSEVSVKNIIDIMQRMGA